MSNGIKAVLKFWGAILSLFLVAVLLDVAENYLGFKNVVICFVIFLFLIITLLIYSINRDH